MLAEPKGLIYWQTDKDGKTIIRETAPEWAKNEFEKYQELLDPKPDKNGMVTRY